MHPQLALLLEIQDLHLQMNALLEEPGVNKMEEDQFKLDSSEAASALQEKIDELMERLEPTYRDRCERGLPALGRMLVPVIGGVCYGCFVSIPTSRSGDPNTDVQSCESCGRFIYVLS